MKGNRMDWELLATLETGRVRRAGRFVVVELDGPHRVLSTSARTGGEALDVRLLVNHQSCEGAGHEARAHLMLDEGPERYHDRVCAEIGAAAASTAVMGTAANMHYVAVARERDVDVEAAAVVTAGVHSNATCAGDPARWREGAEGVVRAAAVAGTINTMLVVSRPLTAPALARAVMTMTEAKSAALSRLAIPSGASADLATGTGTDQYCVAAPIDAAGGAAPLTSTSPHMKLGEIIGVAVRRATLEALRWQNGLEASYTRGVCHALGRFGVTETALMTAVAPHLDETALELLRRNQRAVLMEPLVTAAAYAMASLIDRVRYGTLPASVAADALVQQAATLAISLAAAPSRWSEFRALLHHAARVDGAAADAGRGDAATIDPLPLVAAALALGWREKWPAP
ncbi:MAG TPA: adenosylcobinamide amidohydrolase [Vicinamibacterales bacterium]|nr:adenosylcobinamide amidohydrolase [Vicinamibacterales bacterium]